MASGLARRCRRIGPLSARLSKQEAISSPQADSHRRTVHQEPESGSPRPQDQHASSIVLQVKRRADPSAPSTPRSTRFGAGGSGTCRRRSRRGASRSSAAVAPMAICPAGADHRRGRLTTRTAWGVHAGVRRRLGVSIPRRAAGAPRYYSRTKENPTASTGRPVRAAGRHREIRVGKATSTISMTGRPRARLTATVAADRPTSTWIPWRGAAMPEGVGPARRGPQRVGLSTVGICCIASRPLRVAASSARAGSSRHGGLRGRIISSAASDATPRSDLRDVVRDPRRAARNRVHQPFSPTFPSHRGRALCSSSLLTGASRAAVRLVRP